MSAPRYSPGTEHAPTPWQIGIALYPYVHFYGPSDKAGGALAVGACVTALGKEYDEANAAFIVKAVNEHAEAEKALQELCGRHGFATGHGDTLAGIIREIDGQIPVPGSAQQPSGSVDALRQALDAIQAQCDEMRSLKGWRLNLIRENLAKAYGAVPSTSRCGASDAPEEVTGAEMDAIEAAAIAGNPLTTNDYELAGWARQWHWNDCAGDQPVDPSIYFRDMRMLKAFIQKCQSVTSNHPREVGK